MRRAEPTPQAFQAPVDVHASADGQVYMFRRRHVELSPCSSEEEEEEGCEDPNVLELRPLVYPQPDRVERVHLLEREVLEGDNLNKLALQYRCKVADIKSVNSLLHEQDLFALKSVKIPVQKHSLSTEPNADPTEPGKEISSKSSSTSPAHRDGKTRAARGLQEVTDFFKDVDQDIEKLIRSTNDRRDIFRGTDSSQGGVRGRCVAAEGHGDAWGLQWWNVVVAMLLIGVALPIFYLVYFKTRASGAVAAPGDSAGDMANASADSGGPGLGATGVPLSPEDEG